MLQCNSYSAYGRKYGATAAVAVAAAFCANEEGNKYLICAIHVSWQLHPVGGLGATASGGLISQNGLEGSSLRMEHGEQNW